MTVDFQASLFDDAGAHPTRQGTPPRARVRALHEVRRVDLGTGAWVDVVPAWVAGADDLLSRLVHEVPWRAERREMFDRVVDVPRLTCFYRAGVPLPDPALVEAREALGDHYARELPERFATAGLCFYRDGADSVAWHGDTEGRSSRQDTVVAILSLGDSRRLALRPRPGRARGETRSFLLGHGDLLVMGGSCQRTWEHAVPKSTRPVGPRVSVQFRPYGVR